MNPAVEVELHVCCPWCQARLTVRVPVVPGVRTLHQHTCRATRQRPRRTVQLGLRLVQEQPDRLVHVATWMVLHTGSRRGSGQEKAI
jgi:hypothetical protein